MKFQRFLSIGILGLGLALTPALSTMARAEEPAKEQPKGDKPAHGAKHGPMDFLNRYRASVDKLTLTDAQKPTIDAAFADAKTKIEAIVAEPAADQTATRAKVKPVMTALTDKVTSVLTQDQKDQLAKDHPHHGPAADKAGKDAPK